MLKNANLLANISADTAENELNRAVSVEMASMSSAFEIAPEPASPTRPDGDLDLPDAASRRG